jgi:L-lactate utilization protein LutB
VNGKALESLLRCLLCQSVHSACAQYRSIHNNYLLSEEVSLVYAAVLVSEALPRRRVR